MVICEMEVEMDCAGRSATWKSEGGRLLINGRSVSCLVPYSA
jgi:hypothetical protein